MKRSRESETEGDGKRVKGSDLPEKHNRIESEKSSPSKKLEADSVTETSLADQKAEDAVSSTTASSATSKDSQQEAAENVTKQAEPIENSDSGKPDATSDAQPVQNKETGGDSSAKQSQGEAQTSTENVTENKAEAKTEAKTEAETEAETEGETKAETKAETEAETDQSKVTTTTNKSIASGGSNGSSAAEDSDKKETPAKPSGFASFSSSKPSGFSSFSSGFGGFSGASKFGPSAKTSPKSNPWAEPSNKTTDSEKKDASPVAETSTETANTPNDNSKESSVENDAYAQVKLEKQEIKTGEENENTLFQSRVRLYAMDLTDQEQKSWKERGTGVLKLNKSATEDKYRLLMRADGVLRVSLNLPLVQNMQVTKGFASSLHSEKFVKVAGIESGKAHQFAMRCATEAQRDELFDAITDVLPK